MAEARSSSPGKNKALPLWSFLFKFRLAALTRLWLVCPDKTETKIIGPLKLVLIGDWGVGKTSLLVRFSVRVCCVFDVVACLGCDG